MRMVVAEWKCRDVLGVVE